jgi:hypothetical protein
MRFLALFLLVIITIGCSNPKAETSAQTVKIFRQFSGDMKVLIPGQYHSDCQTMIIQDLTFYGISDERFGNPNSPSATDRTYRRTVHLFQDGNCQILVAELNEDGDYQFFESHLNPNSRFGIALEVNHFMRATTQQYVTYFNEQNFANRADWILANWTNVSQDTNSLIPETIYPEDDAVSVLDHLECSRVNSNQCVTVKLKRL